MNQRGEAQAIGGVNEKIEGFYDICVQRGLSGDQGVSIPRSNVRHLMLKHDVIEAVESGKFQVHAVDTVDQAIELLTGHSAGKPDEKGVYPEGTVNARVVQRLIELEKAGRKHDSEHSENDQKSGSPTS